MNRENDKTVTLRAVGNRKQRIKISQEPELKTLIEVNRQMTQDEKGRTLQYLKDRDNDTYQGEKTKGGIIMSKRRTDCYLDSEGQELEIVFCRATKCMHNKGKGKCGIVGLNGDDKISVDKEGRCENYFTN
ncbi:MAG TPA: hypothetical protein PLX02_02680 [Syntrophorhabdaceae bacterium]|nr:hypothetical protein [Syntrophorhabdaceae bacterium]